MELNKTSERMAELLSAFSELHAEVGRARTYYAGMRGEAKSSFEESKQYWSQKAAAENERLAAMQAEKQAGADELIRKLDQLELQLCAADKSYARRRETEYSVQEYLAMECGPSEDPFAVLKQLYDEAAGIARTCLVTVKTQPVQELGMLFSNKRKQLYERLYYLVTEAKRLRQRAFLELNLDVHDQISGWEEKKQAEIDKAAEETAELIEAIDLREIQEITGIVRRANTRIDGLLPAQAVVDLRELASLLGDANILPDECCEHLLLGDFRADASGLMAYSEAVDYMNSHYQGCFVGSELSLPAVYDLSAGLALCFDGYGDYPAVKAAVHSVLFSMLKNQPASRQTFILSDPEGRAKSFDVYLDIAKKYPDVFGERILTTKEQLKATLRELSRFIDDIGQTRLVGYRDIFDYNTAVPDKQEPLKCLCLLNFPRYFDEDMLEDIANIVRNGQPYGLQVLLGFDEREIGGRQSENQLALISRILAGCVCLKPASGRWMLSNGTLLALAPPPDFHEMRQFAEPFSRQYTVIKDTSLPLTKILAEDWFSGCTGPRLEIPIGKNEDGEIQSLVLGERSSHHALVIGSLGSGKSTLLHTIIMSALLSFSPDELQLYLMDFKSGTEFKVYSERRIPHIRLLALDAMQEFGKSILDELWAEMDRRIALFNELIKEGMDVKDIAAYREMTGKKLPRILVIADEFQLMVSEEHNRKIANYCGGKLADFISLSRVYGIHFILATQTMSRLNSGFAIRKSTLNEMYVRVGLKCIESECNLLFGEKHSRIGFNKMGTEKGTAVYTGDYDQEVPVGFKVAFCDQELQKNLLDAIEEHYSLMESAQKTKLFVGSSVPLLSDCAEFLAPCENGSKSLLVYLGEPIRIAEPTCLSLTRTKRNNLLIVGSNQEKIDALIGLYMANLLRIRTTNRSHRNVYLLDGLSILGEAGSETIRFLRGRPRVRSATDNYDVIRVVDELYSEFLERKEKRGSFDLNAGSMIAVVINNMQWIEPVGAMLSNRSVSEFIPSEEEKAPDSAGSDLSALLSKMDSFLTDLQQTEKRDTSNISYGRKLGELLENGYTCGIHFVMSVPDYISVKEYMYGVIPKFGNRILFDISNEDAGRLVSDAKPEQLRDNIVIYHDGINPSYQIKPYTGVLEYLKRI